MAYHNSVYKEVGLSGHDVVYGKRKSKKESNFTLTQKERDWLRAHPEPIGICQIPGCGNLTTKGKRCSKKNHGGYKNMKEPGSRKPVNTTMAARMKENPKWVAYREE